MKKFTSFLTLVLSLSFSSYAQVHQLWGTTSAGGGSDSAGTVFKINLDGSGFTVKHFFDSLGGYSCHASVALGADGILYGTTQFGGVSDAGIMFSYDLVANLFTKIFDFDYYNSGGYPEGELFSANDGKLYGMTSGGGLNQRGTMFSFDPAGNTFTHLYDFQDAVGTYPFGALTQGLDNKLYGMTSEGGANNGGSIFSYDIGSGTFSFIYNFSGATGNTPNGKLLLANNGLFYGTTAEGGLYDHGVVFSFNPVDSTYSDLYNFNDTAGAAPYGSLIQHVDGLLYGMTLQGGANSIYGTIFNFNPVTGVHSDIFDFNGANGSAPQGDLLSASNGKLYGMTSLGGAHDAGVLFTFDPSNSNYYDLLDFRAGNGKYPWANLIEVNFTAISESAISGSLQLYPNPAISELRIRNRSEGFEKIVIYNTLGEAMFTQEFKERSLNEAVVDVNFLSHGLYFVYVYGVKSRWVGKFIKE